MAPLKHAQREARTSETSCRILDSLPGDCGLDVPGRPTGATPSRAASWSCRGLRHPATEAARPSCRTARPVIGAPHLRPRDRQLRRRAYGGLSGYTKREPPVACRTTRRASFRQAAGRPPGGAAAQLAPAASSTGHLPIHLPDGLGAGATRAASRPKTPGHRSDTRKGHRPRQACFATRRRAWVTPSMRAVPKRPRATHSLPLSRM